MVYQFQSILFLAEFFHPIPNLIFFFGSKPNNIFNQWPTLGTFEHLSRVRYNTFPSIQVFFKENLKVFLVHYRRTPSTRTWSPWSFACEFKREDFMRRKPSALHFLVAIFILHSRENHSKLKNVSKQHPVKKNNRTIQKNKNKKWLVTTHNKSKSFNCYFGKPFEGFFLPFQHCILNSSHLRFNNWDYVAHATVKAGVPWKSFATNKRLPRTSAFAPLSGQARQLRLNIGKY